MILTKQQAREVIRRIMPYRPIRGDEHKQLLTLLLLKEPTESFNNQHTWTDVYEHKSRTYHVTYGLGDIPEIDEKL